MVGIPRSSVVKNPPANEGNVGSIFGSGRPPEKGKATHSSILAWKITWMEEPGGIHSGGSILGMDGGYILCDHGVTKICT